MLWCQWVGGFNVRSGAHVVDCRSDHCHFSTIVCITNFEAGPQAGLGLEDVGTHYAMTEARIEDRTPVFIVYF